MVYIKLEENRDKFLEKYQTIPKTMKNILFKAKCRKGKFEIKKINDRECIVIPEINEKLLKNLKILSNKRCWKTICVSENLKENEQFEKFVRENTLQVLDGKWLFKAMLDQILEYIVEMKNEFLGNQEISILCQKLDEMGAEKIKEICTKVKVCNILTNHSKQFQKLEEEIYQANGIVVNVSNNYKKVLAKSAIILNFDFTSAALEKCIFPKNGYLVSLEKCKIPENNLCHITAFGIDMPEKYREAQKNLEGFSSSMLYESFIYKHTSYRNIKREILSDDAKILYLQDCNYKILKKPNLILPKALDKITI